MCIIISCKDLLYYVMVSVLHKDFLNYVMISVIMQGYNIVCKDFLHAVIAFII